VSRVHCRLTAGARGLEIVDLDSTNGTYINDRPIKRAHLRPGDRLRIGRVLLTVSHE
jgi:pSer/pThr/pTyr-binding forkhead associated (FHA) protein